MATFLLALSAAHSVAIRPVSELPAPDHQRRQYLRAERLQLLDAISLTKAHLAKFRTGEWQPDAGRENGLTFELEALSSRLRGIETVLGTERGGADNG
ncbi:MAG TPA: hypothetical protein VF690_16780 [Hymenobacter sp.]